MGRISMKKANEIFRQRFELHRSYREIATSLNLSASTIADYLARARIASLHWDTIQNMTGQELQDKLFLPAKTNTKYRALPDWGYIHRELKRKGVTQRLLWKEYKDQQPDGPCYSQFCNLYRAYRKTLNPVMRQRHKAGEKVFVDYAGMLVEWIDEITEEIYEAEIFVGCLGASQFIFSEATASQKLPDWIDSHIHMFEYFGGVPEILVPDNLKSAITKAHKYDPDVNNNYQHFSEHYGVAIIPARSKAPKDKAKVENAVGIVERQILAPLRNVTFSSLGEINAAIKKGLQDVNNQKFQKMNTSRKQLFDEIEKPALKTLPKNRYQFAEWKKSKVSLDYHIAYNDHFYSVPYKHIGKTIEIRATNKMIECYLNSEQIAIHEKSPKKYDFTTIKEHMPEGHKEYATYSIDRIKNWGQSIGTSTFEFIEVLLKSKKIPQQSYRACLGLLRLSNKYSEQSLEKACKKALIVGASRYKQVENILKNKLEDEQIEENKIVSKPLNHTNIRGSNFYK